MRDSDRYLAQAEAVSRMATRAANPAERAVYESIAEGWRKLASEARRNEQHKAVGGRPGTSRPPESKPER